MDTAQNNQWLNIPQVTYSSPPSALQEIALQMRPQACDSGVANSCGANAECRKIGPASSLGLCVYRRGTDVYQQIIGRITKKRVGLPSWFWLLWRLQRWIAILTMVVVTTAVAITEVVTIMAVAVITTSLRDNPNISNLVLGPILTEFIKQE